MMGGSFQPLTHPQCKYHRIMYRTHGIKVLFEMTKDWAVHNCMSCVILHVYDTRYWYCLDHILGVLRCLESCERGMWGGVNMLGIHDGHGQLSSWTPK